MHGYAVVAPDGKVVRRVTGESGLMAAVPICNALARRISL